MEEHENDLDVKFRQLSDRLLNGLCIRCGTAENVEKVMCGACLHRSPYQEVMDIENDPKYYLVVGNNSRAEKLRDCQSDHIELAEHEAEEALKSLRAKGDFTSIVRVVEAESRLVVYRIK